jgi:hypothetical protein
VYARQHTGDQIEKHEAPTAVVVSRRGLGSGGLFHRV